MNRTKTKTASEPGHHLAPMLPDWLAYLYQPFLPLLKRIHIKREGERNPNPADILLPEGYVAEVVATGLSASVHCTFDGQGNCYVSETGHKVDSPPRIMKIDLTTGSQQVFYEAPPERWVKSGALTGACWYNGFLYFTNTHMLSRISPDGKVEDLITDLPGYGDHQTNHPVVGPDGKIYFGVGCATNSGVVGADNFAYEWLPIYPIFCDVPAQDITLIGRNFEYHNVLGDLRETVRTGAYVPFGTETHPGQVIPGNVKCTGSILRCDPDGSNLEVVAWGLRNPYGLAFHPDGRLFATEHGMDERSRRYIVDDPDDFYEIQQGAWYGWPDYASGIRMDDPYWGKNGQNREPLIANPPTVNPPKPVISFQTHVASNGVDFSRNADFGFEGDAFVALFGDLAPLTTVTKAVFPVGYKVVRIDMYAKKIYDFAVNRIEGPASKLPHEGFERPSSCRFGPDGALYVVDFGIIKIAPETGGIRIQKGSGVLWRIRRTNEPHGSVPPQPGKAPIYLVQFLGILAGIVGVAFLVQWLVRQLRSRH